MVDNYPRQTYPNHWNKSRMRKLWNRAVGQAYTVMRHEYPLDYDIFKVARLNEIMKEEGATEPTKNMKARAFNRAERALASKYPDRFSEIKALKYKEVKMSDAGYPINRNLPYKD